MKRKHKQAESIFIYCQTVGIAGTCTYNFNTRTGCFSNIHIYAKLLDIVNHESLCIRNLFSEY